MLFQKLTKIYIVNFLNLDYTCYFSGLLIRLTFRNSKIVKNLNYSRNLWKVLKGRNN